MASLNRTVNPFEITKATDFTNAEIEQTWVDLPGASLSDLINSKTSSMPRFLVGGKGGGRTHLMRHQSFSLQAHRAYGRVWDQVLDSGYLGVYFRCGGLNASRFSGKGQSSEVWSALFAYYMDIWLAQMTLGVLHELTEFEPERVPPSEVESTAESILALFDVPPSTAPTEVSPLVRLQQTLRGLQREIDIEVNNSALTRKLEILIRASPGTLVFGVPGSVASHISELKSVRCIYLLDEFENLSEVQQRYVNTLVREKQLPSTFVIGSRLFGIRSHATLSAGEENKIGSEFDQILLEDVYKEARYGKFCMSMVHRRLLDSGFSVRLEDLEDAFEIQQLDTSIHSDWASRLVADVEPLDRPYFVKLRNKLHEFIGTTDNKIEQMVTAMSIPDSPILEKYAVLEFYRGWAKGTYPDLRLARHAGEVARNLASGGSAGRRLASSFRSYAPDLAAQLTRDCKVDMYYSGLQTFIDMSGYLPRNLLIILKQITRWAFFLGERPFTGAKVSLAAQREGVREASEWFYSDAKPLGKLGDETHRGVANLGSYLRSYRFSDKPVEIGVSTFSLNRSEAPPRALECLDTAVNHSMVVEIKDGHRSKNSESIVSKYQLNPMLAPKFDLPLSRRGVLALTTAEAEAIFDPTVSSKQLRNVRRIRLSGLNAPFRDVVGEQDQSDDLPQDELPGVTPLS